MEHDLDQARGSRGIWRVLMWGGLAILLALPALAMSLGAEGVDWDARDFLIMGGLLLVVGLGIELAMRSFRNWRARLMAIGAIMALFLLIWAELAVGVIGTPFAGS